MGLPPPRISEANQVTATGRGKDENELEESRPRTGSGRFDAGREHAGAGAGATVRAVSPGADQAAAGAVRPGRSDLQNLQAQVLRLSPAVLAAVPGGLGLPEPREARRREVVQENESSAHARTRQTAARAKRCEGRDQDPGRPAHSALLPRWPFAVRTEPGQPGARPGNPAAPRTGAEPSVPFELDTARQQPAPPRHREPGRSRPASSASGEGGPELSAPEQTSSASRARERAGSPVTKRRSTASDDGPLLALPESHSAARRRSRRPFGTAARPDAASRRLTTPTDQPTRPVPRRAAAF